MPEENRAPWQLAVAQQHGGSDFLTRVISSWGPPDYLEEAGLMLSHFADEPAEASRGYIKLLKMTRLVSNKAETGPQVF